MSIWGIIGDEYEREFARSQAEFERQMPIQAKVGMDIIADRTYIYKNMLFVALKSTRIENESQLPD